MSPSSHNVGCMPNVIIQRAMDRMVIIMSRIRHDFCHNSSINSESNNESQITMEACIVTPSTRDKMAMSSMPHTFTIPTYQFGAPVKGIKQGY